MNTNKKEIKYFISSISRGAEYNTKLVDARIEITNGKHTFFVHDTDLSIYNNYEIGETIKVFLVSINYKIALSEKNSSYSKIQEIHDFEETEKYYKYLIKTKNGFFLLANLGIIESTLLFLAKKGLFEIFAEIDGDYFPYFLDEHLHN